jgi:serine/threonine protein phosphatase PrpC
MPASSSVATWVRPRRSENPKTTTAAHSEPANASAGSASELRPATPLAIATTAPSAPPAESGACVGCGAPPEDIEPDRYCGQCGLRQPDPRDHQEIDLAIAAGVTDRGRRHRRNEDAMRVAALAGGGTVAVVCDGVSTSISPHIASRVAADAAAESLIAKGAIGSEWLSAGVAEAAAAAQAAVVKVPWTPDGTLAAPSCTYVSATTYEGAVTVGWIGDSRAYWVGPGGARRLTEDDSWATAQTSSGLMTEEQAESDTRAHAITRWLGSDAPEGGPQVNSFHPGERGRLVVCTDGLWNYLTSPEQLAELIGDEPARDSPLAAAQKLTTFALDAGGHDNITVVVIDVALPSSPKSDDTEDTGDTETTEDSEDSEGAA